MSDRLAILIGNGRFGDEPKLDELFGPRHDVSSLGRLLSDPDIGDFVVFELLDRDSSQLDAELQRVFTMCGRDTTLLLYFAGVVVHDDAAGLFLATADVKLTDLRDSAIPMSSIKRLLRGSGSKNIAVVLDCCYCAADGGRAREDLIEKRLRRIRSDVSPNVHIIASPAVAQTPGARELTTESGLEGRMTRCIVEGIETGAADRDGDNRTGVREINEYLGMRLGEQRPLWSGPLEGSDPDIVANPNPIEGADVFVFEAEAVDRHSGRHWGHAALAVVVVALTVFLGVVVRSAMRQTVTPIPESWAGPGLPELIGVVEDFDLLRQVIDRTGWIEHSEPLDGTGLRYPSASTLRLDPDNRGRAGTIDLFPRQWALVDFSDGIYAMGVACAAGLNVADVTVETIDGREYSIEVLTDRPGREFFGVVSRTPIRRVRIHAAETKFVGVTLYVYADSEHTDVSTGAGD